MQPQVLKIPTPREARDVFRMLWGYFLLTPLLPLRYAYGVALDDLGKHCTSGEPKSAFMDFRAFTKAIPGYTKFHEDRNTHRRSIR